MVIGASAWFATRPWAEQAQTGLVLWFNHPPQPVAAVFAVVNPLLRPRPLFLLAVVLVGCILFASQVRGQRL